MIWQPVIDDTKYPPGYVPSRYRRKNKIKKILSKKKIMTQEINWVAMKHSLPTKNTRVWLYNIDDDDYSHDFVHEYELTTRKFFNWTHWALIIAPK